MSYYDDIKEGIAAMQKDATEVYERYDTAEERSQAYDEVQKDIQKEVKRLERWSNTKEGQSTIAIAEEIGFAVVGGLVGGIVGATAGVSLARVRSIYRNKDALIEVGNSSADVVRAAKKINIASEKKRLEAAEVYTDELYAEFKVIESGSKYKGLVKDAKVSDAKAAVFDKKVEKHLKELDKFGDTEDLILKSQKLQKEQIDVIQDNWNAHDKVLELQADLFGTDIESEVTWAVFKGGGVNSSISKKVSSIIKEADDMAELATEVLKTQYDKTMIAASTLFGAYFGSRKGHEQSEIGAYKKEVRGAVEALDSLTDEELLSQGFIRIKGFTRRDGVKIKTHYRKIGK